MLNGLLLALNILVCLALIGVVLMQRSEGGAMGGGGTPGGLVTTRGVGDLLTRTTWILFGIFLALSLTLTLIGGRQRSSEAILNRLKGETVNPNLIPAPRPAAVPGQTPPPATVPAAAPSSLSGSAPAAPRPAVRVPSASSAPATAFPTTAGGFLAPPKPVVGLPAAPAPVTSSGSNPPKP
jgi:preprotein translocase subunit SecG